MTCPTNTYSIEGNNTCLVLPNGIKQYNMISNEAKVSAIVIILIIMLIILFSSLFIIRNNKNKDNQNLNIIDNNKSNRSDDDSIKLNVNPIQIT